MKKFIILLLLISAPFLSSGAHRADYSSLSLDYKDEVLIARTVRAEAKDENYLVKLGVTAMILNRLCDKTFGGDVQDVVYDSGAFFSAERSSIDEDVPEEEIAKYLAMVKIVYERGVDPTCGALFCFLESDPDKDLFTVTLRVDGLAFARP